MSGERKQTAMSGGALYDWFDARCIENMPEVARIGCCHQLAHTLSTLIGLGIPRAVVSAFVLSVAPVRTSMIPEAFPGPTAPVMTFVPDSIRRSVPALAPDQLGQW